MKLINQYKEVITESVTSKAVKKIKDYLDKYYQPVDRTYQVADEFIEKRMVNRLLDEGDMDPSELLKYLSEKFTEYSSEFIKQVVKDWNHGDITNDYQLTTNIPPNGRQDT